jgi:hypothetical protein
MIQSSRISSEMELVRGLIPGKLKKKGTSGTVRYSY